MIRPQPVCDPKRMRAQYSPGSIGSTILGRGFFLGAGLEPVCVRAAFDVNQIAGLQVIPADANLLAHLWSSLPISLNRV